MKKYTNLETGLTTAEVNERVKAGKVNSSLGKTSKSVKQILIDNIFTFYNLVMVVLAGLLFYVGSYRNMLFITVVLGNILIGIITELRAKRTIDKLSLLSRAGINVIRDGIESNIPDQELVEDEIIVLSAGQQIPADAILLNGNLEVNESLLTGESNPIIKNKNDELMSGSFVVSGNGKAYVTHVGKDSYSGKLSTEAKKFKKSNSEIQDSLNSVIFFISILLIPIGIILYCKEFYLLKYSFSESIVSVAGALISLIPSGLVILISSVFVIGIIKLAKYNTLIQNLNSTETLARVDVLCLDKTGTITEGRLKLRKIIPVGGETEADIETILKTLSKNLEDHNPTIDAVREAAENYTVQPIEGIKHLIPFSSARKYSGLSYKNNNSEGTYILGAGSFIFKDKMKEYEPMLKTYLDNGERVLTLAKSVSSVNDYDLPDKLEPIAFLIFSDIIRKEAKSTLDYFEDQGVDLKIISGDDAKTASIIAQRAGLDKADQYVDASTLKTDKDMAEAIKTKNVFGRVTPEQKKFFINSLKKEKHTVGMVGDGVNDILALKEADTSIAMASGSDASRAVANLVLLDSNFASLPKVIKEGRQIINNLEKSSSLYLNKTIYSLLTVFLFLPLTITYLFEPIQLTLLGAVTIGIPSFVLALQPNDDLVHGRFFTNMLYYAIPSGLASFLGILLSVIFCSYLRLPSIMLSTIAFLSELVIGYLLVYKLCTPFNLLRRILFVSIIAIYFIAYFFFQNFFRLALLRIDTLIILLIILAINVSAYLILSKPKVAQTLAEKTTIYLDKFGNWLNKFKLIKFIRR